MKKFSTIIFLMILYITANSQTGYYNSYNDYLKDSIQEMKDISGGSYSFGKYTIIFKNNNGNEQKVKAQSIWGFKYKDKVFRTDHVGNIAMVIVKDDFVYYENGGAHLQMLRNDKKEGDFNSGYACYLSKDLGSNMSPIPSAPISDAKRMYKEFKKEHPEFESLYKCIDYNSRYDNVRICVQNYLKEH